MSSESSAPRALISISGRHSWGLVPHVPCPVVFSSMWGSLSSYAFTHSSQRLCSCHFIRLCCGPPSVILVPTALVRCHCWRQALRACWSHLSLPWWKFALITTARRMRFCLQVLLWPNDFTKPCVLGGLNFFIWRTFRTIWNNHDFLSDEEYFFFWKSEASTCNHLRRCYLFKLCCSIVLVSCGRNLRD